MDFYPLFKNRRSLCVAFSDDPDVPGLMSPLRYNADLNEVEFDSDLVEQTGIQPQLITSITTDLDPFTPCITVDYKPKFVKRKNVSSLYLVATTCAHEQNYYEKYPELNLFREIKGFSIEED
jgi:hypothetical protein